MNLFEDSDGEQGNYIKIETEVIQKFDYRQMHEVFCLSSQTVLDWKVSKKSYNRNYDGFRKPKSTLENWDDTSDAKVCTDTESPKSSIIGC